MDMSAIFMASGFSRRFDGNKLVEPLGGRPLYQYGFMNLKKALRRARPHVTATLVVVTTYDEIADWCAAQGAVVCRNDQAKEGIAASIRIGVEAAEKDAYAFFVADRPLLREDTIADFLVGFVSSGQSLGAMSRDGVPMNPAIFTNAYREELLSLTGDAGAGKLLKGHIKECWKKETTQIEMEDVDTRDDARRLLTYLTTVTLP